MLYIIIGICVSVFALLMILSYMEYTKKKKITENISGVDRLKNARELQYENMIKTSSVLDNMYNDFAVSLNKGQNMNTAASLIQEDNPKKKENSYNTGGEIINSGNRYVDAVVMLKMVECHEKGIEFVAKDLLAGKLMLSETETVRLFQNLLDNAVEAAILSEHPFIKLAIYSLDDSGDDQHIKDEYAGSEIIVSNSKQEKYHPLENQMRTTKQDKENHGLGVGIIKNIVEANGGQVEFVDEDKFTVKIRL